MKADEWVTEADNKAILNSIIDIFPSRYLADPSGRFGDSCQAAVMEFCPAHDDKYTDPASVGTLNIVCGKEVDARFDIISTSRLSWFFNVNRIYLNHTVP